MPLLAVAALLGGASLMVPQFQKGAIGADGVSDVKGTQPGNSDETIEQLCSQDGSSVIGYQGACNVSRTDCGPRTRVTQVQCKSGSSDDEFTFNDCPQGAAVVQVRLAHARYGAQALRRAGLPAGGALLSFPSMESFSSRGEAAEHGCTSSLCISPITVLA